MKMPLISVVVPVYNVENYVSACVGSLIDQTYPNTEIILIDDGSTDGSSALCDRLRQQHSRIRVIHQPNGGLSDARNSGIDAARGEWITFVDSDDTVSPHLLRTLYDMACAHGADVACVTFAAKGEQGVQVLTPEEAIRRILTENTGLTTSAWGKLFRRELFRELRFPKGLIFEDYYLMPALFDAAGTIAFADVPLYFYREDNGDSITKSQFSAKRLEYFTVADTVDRFLQARYPALLPHAHNRSTRYAISFFRQAAQLPQRDRASERFLTHAVRRGILPYLTSRYKLTSKLYGLLITVCPPLAYKLFQRK